jgi:hypothetical protein
MRQVANHVSWFVYMGMAVAVLAGWWEPSAKLVAALAFLANASASRLDLRVAER